MRSAASLSSTYSSVPVRDERPGSDPRAPRRPIPAALDLRPLSTLLARIDAFYHPVEVWLFGSRARGDARADSDWDMLVVVPDDTPEHALDPRLAFRVQRGSGVYADVIPCRLGAFHDDQQTVNTLPYIVAREGLLLVGR